MPQSKTPDLTTLLNQGIKLQTEGHTKESTQKFQKILQYNPNHFHALNLLGMHYANQQNWQQAHDYLSQAINIKNDNADTCANYGSVLRKKGEYDKAETYLKKAIKLNPNRKESYYNLGNLYRECKQYDSALKTYKNITRIDKGCAVAHWQAAELELLKGNFKSGWEDFEWGWQTGKRQTKMPQKHPTAKPWKGEPLGNKTILIWPEQGVGDEIMFSNTLPDIIAQNAQVTICVTERLVPLFNRSFQCITAISATPENFKILHKTHYDYSSPLGTLPRYLRTRIKVFPKHNGYLKADTDKASQLKKTYQNGRKTKIIGLSWRGGMAGKRKTERSIPLKDWLPLLMLEQVTFLSLQYGQVTEEIRTFNQQNNTNIIHDKSINALKDMDAFTAQVAACDLVISVDNTTVHVAGSIGKSVWTLLPENSDWRWMLDRTDSPWYPSMTLFRQQKAGQWPDVIKALKSLVNNEKINPAVATPQCEF